MIEATNLKYIVLRKYFLSGILLISIITTLKRLIDTDPQGYLRRISTVIMVARATSLTITSIFCYATDTNIVLMVWGCLLVCLIDIIRHNRLLLGLIQNNIKVIIEYIIIIGAICYIYAIFIVRNR